MSKDYDEYLNEHRKAVFAAYQWITENVPEVLADLDKDIDWQMQFNHDASKGDREEYQAYDAYFYGGNKSYQVLKDFDYAWLHHIHNNPHHWQYWLLFEDDPELGTPYKALEIPFEYVIEMICDWWSFSFRSGDLREIFNWYDAHKDIMKLHPKTRKLVEDILGVIKRKLDEIQPVEVVEITARPEDKTEEVKEDDVID